jgi:DNA-binding MarR family transcriptional regulator
LSKIRDTSNHDQRGSSGARWTFLSNHAHVLLLLAKDPDLRLREIAEQVGITERAVQRIVTDLERDQYIEREKIGRRNRYRVHPELPLRHPLEAHRKIAALITLVVGE